MKPGTPTPVEGVLGMPPLWVSQKPNNPMEATSQSTFIKTQIIYHQTSSPTSIINVVDQFTKGTKGIMHQIALLKSENQILCKENNVLSWRQRI